MKINLDGTEGQWRYAECHTVVGSTMSDHSNGPCNRCGAPMRFVHELRCSLALGKRLRIYGEQIYVGVDCAAILIDPDLYDIPRLAEQETARKERWRRDVYDSPGTCKTTIEDLRERGKL